MNKIVYQHVPISIELIAFFISALRKTVRFQRDSKLMALNL